MDFGFLVFRSLILFLGIIFFIIGTIETKTLFNKKNQSKEIDNVDLLFAGLLLLAGLMTIAIVVFMER